MGWGVWHELEKRLDTKISGSYAPAFFLPSFEIRDVRFEWDEKVKLLSGHLKVGYDPLGFLFGQDLRVRLSGRDLKAELLGEWAESQGLRELPLEEFQAEITVGPKGLKEISSLTVESSVFQFHIQKTEIVTEGHSARQEKKV